MKEFVSIKVSSFDHAALATSLTSKAADGWDVVSVVAVGNDIVAYLSRETLSGSTDTKSSNVSSTASSSSASTSAPVATASGTSEPAGWAAATTTDAASAPTQAMSTTAAAETSSATTSSAKAGATASSTTPSVPADWYKDPSGRYEYRYWDGQKWTEHVSRAGTVYKDPPTP